MSEIWVAHQLWCKEKSYKNFAKLSCGLSNKEYDEVLGRCKNAIHVTKQEIDRFQVPEVADFLEELSDNWVLEL